MELKVLKNGMVIRPRQFAKNPVHGVESSFRKAKIPDDVKRVLNPVHGVESLSKLLCRLEVHDLDYVNPVHGVESTLVYEAWVELPVHTESGAWS